MAGPLNMLIILPTIMTACGILLIVFSVIIIFTLVICNSITKNKEKKVEENAHNSIIKQLDIQYSKVPVTERVRLPTESDTGSGSESSLLHA